MPASPRRQRSLKSFHGELLKIDFAQCHAFCTLANWLHCPHPGAVKEREMELFRNMEVALVLCFGLVCAAAFFVRPPPRAVGSETSALSPALATPMPVVVITGKRLSAAQKRGLSKDNA
jgi:cytochrome bd-type quinol oxidase subunit 2